MKNKDFYNEFIKKKPGSWWYREDLLYRLWYSVGGEDMQFAFFMRAMGFIILIGLVISGGMIILLNN